MTTPTTTPKPTKKSDEPDMVRGALQPATREGFAELMKNANTFLASEEGKGYRLLTIVRLEKAIAAVYTRVAAKQKITEFWEEDDNEV